MKKQIKRYGKPCKAKNPALQRADHRKIEKELTARICQQAAVAKLGQQALSGLGLSKLLDEAVALIANTVNVEYCKVLELLPDGRNLLLRAGVGWKKGLVGNATVGTERDSQAGYTLLSSEPVIVEDLRKETRFSGPPLLHEHGVVSGMSVIVQGQNRPFGVLGVHTTLLKYFTKDDIHFLQGVANVLASAIMQEQAKEHLFKTSKLESLGILAGGIAHDFNNILTAILANVSFAKMFIKPEDQIYQMLTEAEKASLRARDLTQQLLTFSKGGAPVKKTASIEGVIKDSAGFVLRGSSIKCEIIIPDKLWSVEIDEGQMTQAFNNLIINADQAMAGGGMVYVRCENIEIKKTKEGIGLPLNKGRYVKIAVEDSGVGIPSEHLQKIFDPYFTTKQRGSGLGLATTYSIIKSHNGHICVESKVGAGTTFYIYLPASLKKISRQQNKAKEACFICKGKILLMDDEDSIRIALGNMLKQMGFEVECARDGAEAIELYIKGMESGQPFAAVIMDLTIPGGMGGKEAIKKLLGIDPEAKAIVSSGYSDDPVMAEFRKYGYRGVIAKPYEAEELSRALSEVIKGKNN